MATLMRESSDLPESRLGIFSSHPFNIIILLFDLWTPEILELELFINSNAITARMYNTKNGKEC